MDLIDRQAAIDICEKISGNRYLSADGNIGAEMCAERIAQLPSAQSTTCKYWDDESSFCALHRPSAQPEQRWIPFKTRPLTEEEKEEHPEWEFILDCPLPDDGQRILVNIKCRGHEAVQLDEYYDDDGSYLDSGYEIETEATAWMPLPEPYTERRKE